MFHVAAKEQNSDSKPLYCLLSRSVPEEPAENAAVCVEEVRFAILIGVLVVYVRVSVDTLPESLAPL